MKTIKTYLLNCSLHGIPFIADSRFHWSERLFWTLSVILSWYISAYIMFNSYNQFQNNAISFTVDTSYLDWKINFPAVIFCEKGNSKYHEYASEWFGKDRDFDVDEVLKDIAFFKGSLEGISLKCLKSSTEFEDGCPLVDANYTLYSDIIRSKCHDIFQYCSWNGKEFNCCDHILPVHTVYGECYGINSLVSKATPKSPFPMVVSHQPNAGVGTLSVELLNPDTKIFVLSREAVPLYTETSNVVMDGVAIAPHYKDENNIYLSVEEVVNEKEVKSTSIERRGCRFPEENDLITSNVYSYSACTTDCLTHLQSELCNCNHHLMPIIKKNICDMEGLACLSGLFADMIREIAKCDCQSSCTETKMTVLGFISRDNFTKFKYETSITRVNIILHAPTLRYIRKVVNGYLDLIVSMGGSVGLCVGGSVLTAVEKLYYLFVRPLSDRIKQHKILQMRRRLIYDNRRKIRKPQFPFVL